MTKIKNLLKTSVAVIAVLLLLTISTNAFLSSASGQRSPCDNGTITRSTKALPVISYMAITKIQGYGLSGSNYSHKMLFRLYSNFSPIPNTNG